ncbi:MAG TPA: Ig domain-containing protein [Myxococcales bacterium]|nr:Ig domain-containing protein [Myxococcales bacterium]
MRAALGLLVAWIAACSAPLPERPDAAPPEVDPTTLAPQVVTAQLASAVAGTPYGDRLLAKDGAPPYTWAVLGPGWLSIDPGTGELRGTPLPGAAGTQVTLTATATDTAGRSGNKAFTIQILACAPGQALACQQASAGTCRVGVQVCQPGGTWSGCDAGAASTSASGCGQGCAACGPDADRCVSNGAQCACGASASACAAGSSCCSIPDGGARCANLAADPAACGSCGTRCAQPLDADPTCDAGVCGATCRPGHAACDGRTLDGCEVNLATDPDHCGTCAITCAFSGRGARICDGGACDLACNAGFPQHCGLADCRAYDIANCGGCGAACANPGVNAGAPTGCAGPGACTYGCNAGWGDCDQGLDGCETDLNITPTHCGTCSNDCVAQGWDGGCVNGQCARCYRCPQNPGGTYTTCCGQKCQYNPGDMIYDCVPCAPGSLVDGGC